MVPKVSYTFGKITPRDEHLIHGVNQVIGDLVCITYNDGERSKKSIAEYLSRNYIEHDEFGMRRIMAHHYPDDARAQWEMRDGMIYAIQHLEQLFYPGHTPENLIPAEGEPGTEDLDNYTYWKD